MKTKPYPNEKRFAPFRRHILGIGEKVPTLLGSKSMIYADWAASGRMYWPIEENLIYKVYPWMANPLSQGSIGGEITKKAFAQVKGVVHKHLNARSSDRVLPLGPDNLGPMEAFRMILGIRQWAGHDMPQGAPRVFLSPGEPPSRQQAWNKSEVDLHMISVDDHGAIDVAAFERELHNTQNPNILVVLQACCPVTGHHFPYHTLADIVHKYGGVVLVDFTASAPYVDINMHPGPTDHLDAVLFSPRTFLGGPGGADILVFNTNLIQLFSETALLGSERPTGTANGQEILQQFLQWNTDVAAVIRAGMAVELKESMGTHWMQQRLREINGLVYDRLYQIQGLHLLGSSDHYRIPIFCVDLKGVHHELVVRLLADRFGIQASWILDRDTCGPQNGERIWEILDDTIEMVPRPEGWTRLSFHPTTTDQEIEQVCYAIGTIAEKGMAWSSGYRWGDEGLEPKNPIGADFHKVPEDWLTLQRPQDHYNRS